MPIMGNAEDEKELKMMSSTFLLGKIGQNEDKIDYYNDLLVFYHHLVQ